MIVVTGATGHYGRKVVELLLEKLPSSQIGVSVQDPQKAADLAGCGVRVLAGSFSNPSTLAAAFEGAEQVLLVSVNLLGEEAIRLHANAIQAVKRAGARRILYTSHQAASPASKVAFARDHAATEALLRDSGIPFVALRNGFYAESALYQFGGVRQTGRLALPEDGPVSWTARDDLAEAGAEALLQPELFDGVTPPLTGSRTYTFAEVGQLCSELLQRPIVRETVTHSRYQQESLERGTPAPVVGMLISMFEAMRANEFNIVDPTLARVLGRQPLELKEVLASFLSDR